MYTYLYTSILVSTRLYTSIMVSNGISRLNLRTRDQPFKELTVKR